MFGLSIVPGSRHAVPARQISKGVPAYSFLQSWERNVAIKRVFIFVF